MTPLASQRRGVREDVENMPVLFLDVDGVLNCHETWKRKDGQRGTFRLCPDRVRLLMSLLDQTGARVVLSSTWRESQDHVDYLRFRAPGVAQRFHEDWRTRRLEVVVAKDGDRDIYSSAPRGDEIAEWLSRHPGVSRFAIVDDDSDMLPEQMTHFVQTNFTDGLLSSHVDQLAEILTDFPYKQSAKEQEGRD